MRSRYYRRTMRVQGNVGLFGTRESLVILAKVANHNADLLEEASNEIAVLKQKIQTMEEVQTNEDKRIG